MVLTKKEKFIEASKAYFTTRRIAYLGVFSALASLLYIFWSFSIPGIFPGFLSMNLSDIPVLISGFMLGPIAGIIVVVFRMIIKLSFGLSSTGGVGELSDLILGIALVLPAALIYKKWRTHDGAVAGLIVGSLASTGLAVLSNWLIIVPLFATIVPGGFDTIVGAMRVIHPNVTTNTFWAYYLSFVVVPFNLIRTIGSACATYLIYSGLKKADKRLFGEGKKKVKILEVGNSVPNDTDNKTHKNISKSEKETFDMGFRLASKLKLGDIVLLNGEVGVGKTVFSKGICLGLGISEAVLSPTFTIMNVYDLSNNGQLCHIDAYRLKSEDEAHEAGLGDYIGDKNTISLVEWYENIESFFENKNCIIVKINRINETERDIIIS
ncbi:MAG: tRNA (adenosine(37)-N6)-threonylcarbamoyltransferase complex ATPase subunit type 1 TsaE [Firmicutes bacterium]|nr:tRNA (adenosine(37)-N6)-threonylcarbamoyltransferase complex ATPase subunit type 1 TsaE [Bacillota bacterium]